MPVLSPIVGHLLLPDLVPAPTSPPNWSDPAFSAQVRFLDTHLHGRQYLLGDELTLADFSVAGMTMYLHAAGFPWNSYPEFAAWYARVEGLAAWRETGVAPWKR